MSLSGAQYKQACHDIMKALPSVVRLERFLFENFRDIYNAVTFPSSLAHAASGAVRAAESRGELQTLLTAAAQAQVDKPQALPLLTNQLYLLQHLCAASAPLATLAANPALCAQATRNLRHLLDSMGALVGEAQLALDEVEVAAGLVDAEGRRLDEGLVPRQVDETTHFAVGAQAGRLVAACGADDGAASWVKERVTCEACVPR